jgi:anti-sigma regulatory factor (Ser/Thr protein kinase)
MFEVARVHACSTRTTRPNPRLRRTEGRNENVSSHRRSVIALHRTPTAPRAARRHLEGVIRRGDGIVDVADLLVTELVTNSVRHGGRAEDDRVEVLIELDDDRIRVEVRDQGGGSAPLEPMLERPDEGGFGLLFVNTLADRWGSERRDDGTVVWFEIDTDAAREGARTDPSA